MRLWKRLTFLIQQTGNQVLSVTTFGNICILENYNLFIDFWLVFLLLLHLTFKDIKNFEFHVTKENKTYFKKE